MNFKEFGRVIEPAPEGGFPEFGKIVEPVSRARSLAGAPVKGAIKEVADIGEFFQRVPLPKGPFNPGKVREFAEEKFPTQEKAPEKFLERAGRLVPGALLGPGSAAVKGGQVLAGAALGEGLGALELPGWAQSIAESLPFFYSGGKKIPLKAPQKKLGEFLRKNGLSENEITPLLKTPEQINRWSGFARKGKKSRKLMDAIYAKSGKIYDSIIEESKNLPELSDRAMTNLSNEIDLLYRDMPDKYRKLIKQDITDFRNSRGGIEDVINLDKDVNAVIGAEQGGKAVLGRFKEPLKNAIKTVSPELSEDYQLAKDLYRTRANVKGSLVSPKDFDKFLDVGEAFGLAQGIANRDLGMIAKVIGAAGGRDLARELLINPRLQNKAVRIGEALKNNKLTLVEKFMREFKSDLEKENPMLASILTEANVR